MARISTSWGALPPPYGISLTLPFSGYFILVSRLLVSFASFLCFFFYLLYRVHSKWVCYYCCWYSLLSEWIFTFLPRAGVLRSTYVIIRKKITNFQVSNTELPIYLTLSYLERRPSFYCMLLPTSKKRLNVDHETYWSSRRESQAYQEHRKRWDYRELSARVSKCTNHPRPPAQTIPITGNGTIGYVSSIQRTLFIYQRYKSRAVSKKLTCSHDRCCYTKNCWLLELSVVFQWYSN